MRHEKVSEWIRVCQESFSPCGTAIVRVLGDDDEELADFVRERFHPSSKLGVGVLCAFDDELASDTDGDDLGKYVLYVLADALPVRSGPHMFAICTPGTIVSFDKAPWEEVAREQA